MAKVRLVLYVEPETIKKIEEKAGKEKRTVSAMGEIMLERDLAREAKSRAPAA